MKCNGIAPFRIPKQSRPTAEIDSGKTAAERRGDQRRRPNEIEMEIIRNVIT